MNVFLEHLAAWGGAWTAQDLEHVSISIMFFGGGLVGLNMLNLVCNTNNCPSAACSLNLTVSARGSTHQSPSFPHETTFVSKNPLP
jgi:Protein of unknown function (Ytp1)